MEDESRRKELEHRYKAVRTEERTNGKESDQESDATFDGEASRSTSDLRLTI